MQKKNESDYLQRVQYYAAHSYTLQLPKGGEHGKLLPIIVISLIKHKIFSDEVPCISFHKMAETVTGKQYLFDMSYVFIELGKHDKQNLSNIAEEWLHLFKCAEDESEPPKGLKSTKVLDAYHLIEKHSMSPEAYDLFIRTKLYEDSIAISMREEFAKGITEGIEQGKLEGIEQGIEQGEKKKSIEIARKLLSENIDINTISLATGLTTHEIEKLKS